MNAASIIERVVRIIQDDSYSDDDILDILNEGRAFIAAEIEPGLPALQTSDTVTTTSALNVVDLPEDYHKGLFWVGSLAQRRRIGTRKSDYHNLLTYLEKYPTDGTVGNIEDVCVDGATLLYHAMADDTLTLKYFKNVEDITDADTESPSELPTHLQARLLVSYCCKELYAEIEDGDEGATPNYDAYSKKFDRAMAELDAYCRKSYPKEAKQIRDVE